MCKCFLTYSLWADRDFLFCLYDVSITDWTFKILLFWKSKLSLQQLINTLQINTIRSKRLVTIITLCDFCRTKRGKHECKKNKSKTTAIMYCGVSRVTLSTWSNCFEIIASDCIYFQNVYKSFFKAIGSLVVMVSRFGSVGLVRFWMPPKTHWVHAVLIKPVLPSISWSISSLPWILPLEKISFPCQRLVVEIVEAEMDGAAICRIERGRNRTHAIAK